MTQGRRVQGDPGSTETLRGSRTWRPGLSIFRISASWALPSRREWQRKPPKWTTELRLASKEKVWASGRALEFGGVPDGEREGFDDGGLELVVLDLNLVETAFALHEV